MKNNKWVKVGLAVLALVCLWVATYNIWSIHLDKEIERRFEMMEAEPITVSDVYIDSLGYNLTDMTPEVDITDTIVDVTVTYPDEEAQKKQAYIVYSNTDVPRYVDDKYGKILLPNEWRKN